IVLLIVIFIRLQVRKPLTRMVELMRRQEEVPPTGAEELQFVTRTYNAILSENRMAREKLSHEASHDRLTGLFNRGAYEMMLESVDMNHVALILIDVDYFKSVNDTYGHDVGDKVLKRVAEVLKQSFRSVDIICRIGGDEFVVIMTRADSSMRELVRSKIARANEMLQNPKDSLPPVSLSVGVAFSDRKNPKGDIFKDADTALYRVKEAGRRGCEIF
ncbi:MAG: GGDEF domain-containing protein, partial [Clostridia bacterium]|nr:GGDEF domain-containing protein [Clostridia bacterium]